MNGNFFDEEFLDLIANGDRHDLAIYRNRILDELKIRAEQDSHEKMADILKLATREQKSLERRYKIMSFVFVIFALIGLGLVIINIIEGKIFIAVFDALIVVANSLNALMYRQKQKMASIMFAPELLVVTSNTRGSVFHDDTEMLKKKKARLDEILGL